MRLMVAAMRSLKPIPDILDRVGCKYSNDVQGTVPGAFGAGMLSQSTSDGLVPLVVADVGKLTSYDAR